MRVEALYIAVFFSCVAAASGLRSASAHTIRLELPSATRTFPTTFSALQQLIAQRGMAISNLSGPYQSPSSRGNMESASLTAGSGSSAVVVNWFHYEAAQDALDRDTSLRSMWGANGGVRWRRQGGTMIEVNTLAYDGAVAQKFLDDLLGAEQ